MTVIIDANIIISALINPNGKEAVFILNYSDKVDFVAPDLIYKEVVSKKSKILKSSHHTEETLQTSLELITNNISVFSVSKYDPSILKVARELTSGIDENDVQYIALTILLEGLFWTGDLRLLRGLKRKGFKHIITTSDFEQIIKGL